MGWKFLSTPSAFFSSSVTANSYEKEPGSRARGLINTLRLDKNPYTPIFMDDEARIPDEYQTLPELGSGEYSPVLSRSLFSLIGSQSNTDSPRGRDRPPRQNQKDINLVSTIITRKSAELTQSTSCSSSLNEERLNVQLFPLIPPSNLNQSDSASMSSVTSTATAHSKTIKTKRAYTISMDEFLRSVEPTWFMYHGRAWSDTPIPLSWYDNYRARFFGQNNRDGLLDTCIEILVQDGRNVRNGNTNKSILGLKDHIPSSDFKQIFTSLKESSSNSPLEAGTILDVGCKLMMLKSNSFLQKALIVQSLPNPEDWSPTSCHFPFPAFEAHVNWQLLKAGKDGLDGLGSNYKKIRYVEYLALLMRKTKKFILGVFSAYGPNVLNYPIRVLQILHHRKLLRPGTLLFDIIKQMEPSAENYMEFKATPKGIQNEMIEGTPGHAPLLGTAKLLTVAQPATTTSDTGGTSRKEKPTTISRSEFEACAVLTWKWFYGEVNAPCIPNEWFTLYKSQFPLPNDIDGCIDILLSDHKAFPEVGSYKIPRLSDVLDQKSFSAVFARMKFIRESSEGVSSKTDVELIRSNSSFLQQALVEPLKLDRNATSQQKASSIPVPSEWCPSQCAFPFCAFEAHVLRCLRLKGNDRVEFFPHILKLRYVEYLSVLMSKTEQFILGVFTAYGPNVLNYPIRSLQILKRRNLLRPGTLLVSHIQDGLSADQVYSPIEVGTNKKQSSMGSNDSLFLSKISTNIAVSKEQAAPSVRNRSGTVNPLLVPTSSAPTSPSFSAELIEEAKSHTISEKDFLSCARTAWSNFYGSGTLKPIPHDWYLNYTSQFPDPNNANGILGNCIHILVCDQDQSKELGYKIKIPLAAELSGSGAITSDLVESFPKQPQIILTPTSGCEARMLNGRSRLQKAIIEPVKPIQEGYDTQKNKFVPQPTEWCPSKCLFPFPAFFAHVFWVLQRAKTDRPLAKLAKVDLKHLDLEIFKLRYVEYSALLHDLPCQLLLGIFSAYGHDIMQYPIRVLQILKQKELLRAGTKLYAAIDPNSFSGSYSPITNPRKTPVTTIRDSASNPGDDNTSGVTTSQDSPFQSWKVAFDTTVEGLYTKLTPELSIPEDIYGELFEYFSVFKMEGQRDMRVFVIGVWAGLRMLIGDRKHQSTQVSFPNEDDVVPFDVPRKEMIRQGRMTPGHFTAPASSPPRILQLDENGIQVMKELRISPNIRVESIHNTFVSMKKLEWDVMDKIQAEFTTEESIREFVKQVSFHICCVTDDEDMKLSALLIHGLLSRKLISKLYVIHSIKNGAIKDLPQLSVRVINVIPRLASFLVHLFSTEEDFCWFRWLTENLRRDFLPVWTDLTQKTVEVLRRRTSESNFRGIFHRTPDAHEEILDLI